MITTTPTAPHRPDHRSAMRIGATEYQRFVDLISALDPDDWTQPTDCTSWDVKAVVAHNLGNLAANASIRENVHQMRTAKRRAKASGTSMVDEMTALQVDERASLTPTEMCQRVAAITPAALAGRRRVPGLMRRVVKIALPPPWDSMTLGFLIDTIYNRDMWMHRVDICRASGRELVLDADHDGQVVSEIVLDWAARHGQPYDLVLEGPAGGTFRDGNGGEQLQLDAVEFCRIVSGRDASDARGLLRTPVLF